MFDFGFGFGFGYCKRLYNQINNIYQIKKYIDIIFKEFDCECDNNNIDIDNDKNKDIKQNENFESLKQIIFSCGSLYIKFFQWYISKLKSSIVNINKNNSIETADTDSNTDTDTNSDSDSNVGMI